MEMELQLEMEMTTFTALRIPFCTEEKQTSVNLPSSLLLHLSLVIVLFLFFLLLPLEQLQYPLATVNTSAPPTAHPSEVWPSLSFSFGFSFNFSFSFSLHLTVSSACGLSYPLIAHVQLVRLSNSTWLWFLHLACFGFLFGLTLLVSNRSRTELN